MRKIIKIYFNITLLVLMASPLSTQAFSLDDFFDDLGKYFIEEDAFDSITTSSVQVINKVNVSANTGGNVAGPGEVVEGKSEVKIQIENIINGQSIEPVDLEVESENGEAKVEVEQKITYPDEQGQVLVEREIEINEQIEDTEESQTPKGEIDSQTQNETFSELTNNFSQWWSSFFEGLKETLASIISFWK